MKRSQLIQIIKEEVASVVGEISLMSGDADKTSSSELFYQYVKGTESNDPIRKVITNLYGKDSMDSWNSSGWWIYRKDVRDSPLDARISAAIKSRAIDSQGSLYITAARSKASGRLVHVLWKLDEPAKTAFVGQIDTEPSTGPYSMKTAYGIDSKVVHWSDLAQEYKGVGYGKFLYDTLLYKYGTLESDNTLYTGSQRMWMNHMPRVAKLFCYTVRHDSVFFTSGGSQSEEQLIVLPATERDVADRRFLEDRVGSFIAFHDTIPAEVAKLARFAKGLSYREGTLGIAFVQENINAKILTSDDMAQATAATESFIDLIENLSFDEVIDLIPNLDEVSFENLDKAKKLIVAFQDATLLLEPSGTDIKYTLL